MRSLQEVNEHFSTTSNAESGHLKQSGSSTLEFIFCAPLLLVIMFIAMEVNERIEHRVTATIAAGNAAWVVNADRSSLDPNTTNQVQDIVKTDVLGESSTTAKNMMTYSENKRHGEAYTARVIRRTDDAATNAAAARAGTLVGETRFDRVAGTLGGVSSDLTSVVKTITDPPISWLPSAFPAKNIEEQRLTWSISSQGTSNAAISTIEGLAKSLNGDITGDLQDPTSREYRILAHKSLYLRRYPAYHPRSEEYRSEVLVGLMLGSIDPDGYGKFVDECFMKFKSDICGQTNGFVAYIKGIHRLLTTGKTFVDTAAISCIASTIGVGTGACLIPTAQVIGVEQLLTMAIDKAVDEAIKKVSDAAVSAVKDAVGKAVADIKTKIKKSIGDLHKKISESAGDILQDEDQTP